MTLLKLTFTPHQRSTSTEHPHSYVLMVDEDAYQRYKHEPASIPLAQVVDDFTIYRYINPGMSGTIECPSNSELEQVFGMTNEQDIAAFVLEHGKPHGSVRVL